MAEPETSLPTIIEHAPRDAVEPQSSDNAVVEQSPDQEVATGDYRDTAVGVPRPEGGFSSPAVVDWTFKKMAWWDEARTAGLRARWQNNPSANFAMAAAFEKAHPDAAAPLLDAGFAFHPALVEAMAILGRKYAVVPGKSSDIMQGEESPVGNPIPRDAFESTKDDLRRRAAEASAHGNFRLANALSEEERQLYDRQFGDQGVVDGSTRTA